MEQVSMNDGLDGRETLAFGLAAGEVAVFVLALLSAYAVLRSALPGAIAWTLAVLVAGGGALLAWGRLAGRPLVEWAVLLAAFTVRTRHARVARMRHRLHRWRADVGVAMTSRTAAAGRANQGGAVVIPLALRRVERRGRAASGTAPPAGTSPSHVVGFFSLAGGAGRTTLAAEVATILAVRGRVARAAGAAAPSVALLDLARRNPTAGLRLGMPAPPEGQDALITHHTGLLVGLPAACAVPPGRDAPAPAALIESAERAGAHLVIVDFDCDAGDACTALLRRCDRLLVTLTPTAVGVVDAYRSTALLRRIGVRDRIGYVVNRWRPDVDLNEAMADLGGVIVAEIPEDPALAANWRHSAVAMDGGGGVTAGLDRLATHIENGDVRSAPGVPRWGSHAG